MQQVRCRAQTLLLLRPGWTRLPADRSNTTSIDTARVGGACSPTQGPPLPSVLPFPTLDLGGAWPRAENEQGLAASNAV